MLPKENQILDWTTMMSQKKKLSKKPLKNQKLTQTLQTNYSFMTLVAPSNKYYHWHSKGSSDCSLPLCHRTSPTWQEFCHGKELIVKHIDSPQVLLCWQGKAQRLRDDLGSHVPLHAHAADLHVPSVLLAELRRELLGGKAVKALCVWNRQIRYRKKATDSIGWTRSLP